MESRELLTVGFMPFIPPGGLPCGISQDRWDSFPENPDPPTGSPSEINIDGQNPASPTNPGHDLGDLPGDAGSLFDGIIIESPTFDGDGSVFGSITFGDDSVSALLHHVVDDDEVLGHYLLAIQPSGDSLADLIPEVSGTIADQFNVSTPILAFSTEEVRLDSNELSELAVDFYDDLYGDSEFSLRIDAGINLLSKAEVTEGSEVNGIFSTFGVDFPEIHLFGRGRAAGLQSPDPP